MPQDDISTSYLLWAMRHSESELVHQAAGSTFEAITGKQLRSHVLPIAPLPQQARIVAAIEEHFSRLNAVHSAVEAAQQKLEALLQSVLKETCSGSWPESELKELIVSLKNGVFVSRPSLDPPGKPIYRISAVRPLALRVSEIRYVHPTPHKSDSYAVEDRGLGTSQSGRTAHRGTASSVTTWASRSLRRPTWIGSALALSST